LGSGSWKIQMKIRVGVDVGVGGNGEKSSYADDHREVGVVRKDKY
jgi:hypothetical protein